MQYIVITVLAATLTISCKQNKWNKKYLKKECVEAQLKNNPNLDKKMVEITCECMAERRVKMFKSEKESMRGDGAELFLISTECAEEGLKAIGKAAQAGSSSLDTADIKRLDSISKLPR
jgi:hypothetical protein